MLTGLAWLFPYLLFFHVLGAIAGFGPSFVFPIVGAMGGTEREHGNFADARLGDDLEPAPSTRSGSLCRSPVR